MTTLIRRRPIVAGAGFGLVWGVTMRAWMRYISTDPEFSWGGTLFIVGATTVVGALLGFARHRRQVGGVGWWRLTFVSLILLGSGGAVMWPSVILGAVAIGHPRPRWMRWVLGLGAVGAQVPVLQGAVVENWRFTTLDMVIAVVWYAPMLAAEAWAYSVAFAPAKTPFSRTRPEPRLGFRARERSSVSDDTAIFDN